MSEKKLIKNSRVSVVIPTLGGELLHYTIEKLNCGTLVPKEILVCIPYEDAYKVEHLSYPNLKIIKTHSRGQVLQRAIGFQTASEPLVLQIDDDVQLDESCLKILVEFIEAKNNISVSPSLLDSITGKPSSFMSKPGESSSPLYKLLFLAINGKDGYQPGKISKAGVNMAYSETAKDAYEVEWLPGGCVLHARENLVKYDYYPFKGKAYGEDLFHSVILRRKGLTLYHCPKAACSLDNSSVKGKGMLSLIDIFYKSSRVRFRFASLTGSNRLRLICFLILHFSLLIISKIRKK